MATKRRIVLIGRHGKAPQKPEGGSVDELVPGVVGELYQNVGLPLQTVVQEYRYTPHRMFLAHTNKQRTRYTGEAMLVGALDLHTSGFPNGPQNQEDLRAYGGFDANAGPLKMVPTWQDDRFSIGRPFNINMKVYRERGAVANVDYWLAEPDAVFQEGEPIESGRSVRARTAAGLYDTIGYMLQNGGRADCGLIVTHSPMAEAAWVNLINSGRVGQILKVADIGGMCWMGEFSRLTIDESRGGTYSTRLNLKGRDYHVDLRKLL